MCVVNEKQNHQIVIPWNLETLFQKFPGYASEFTNNANFSGQQFL